MATDKDEAYELHRDALHSIVFDMMNWLAKQRTAEKQKCLHGNASKDSQRKKEAAKHAIRADVFAEAVEKLKQLRRLHKETSARSSVIGHQLAEGGAINDPTPEQIAAKCEEIRSGWSEKERANRHWQKNNETDFDKPTNFIF